MNILSLFTTNNEVVFLPENVLINTSTQLTWYTKPQKRNMFFKGNKHKRFHVPYPALIWSVNISKRLLTVFALKSGERPSLNTELFFAPLGNINSQGQVCQGSARLPETICLAAIPEIQDTVFDSNFTEIHNANNLAGNKGSRIRTHVKYWQDLHTNKADKFPVNDLVTTGKKANILSSMLT